MNSRSFWAVSVSGIALGLMASHIPSNAFAQETLLPVAAAQDEAELTTANHETVQQETIGQDQVVAQPVPTRPNINPYDRDIGMTVPLQFNRRVLGELDVVLTRDDRFRVSSVSFISHISPLLTPDAKQELIDALSGKEMFEADEIVGSGISLNYDPDLLAVLVLRIDANKRALERLFEDNSPEEPGATPENFSAYLNTNVSISKLHGLSGISDPAFNMMGALRYKYLVFESEFSLRKEFGSDEYSAQRRYGRFVYDQPDSYRRWWLGDIDPEFRGRQGYVNLGGIGVARQTRRFDSFRRNILAGDRKIVLQDDSTVRVMRNGVFVREFRLDAGQYDLSNLPLNYGSNDLQIEIRNGAGQVENVKYSAYLDMVDLEPGDYEYGAYIGILNNSAFTSPKYKDGDHVFTGYWIKAFESRPAIGLGLQLSEGVQSVSSQSQIILSNGARLRGDIGLSQSDNGGGYAASATYEHFVEIGDKVNSWAVSVEYTSENFAMLGSYGMTNQTEWSFSGSYSHQFTNDFGVSIYSSYQIGRGDIAGNSYSFGAYSNYQIRDDVSLILGVDYINYGIDNAKADLNFNVGLVWQMRGNRRLEGRYDSRGNSASVVYSQMPKSNVGNLGYTISADYADGAGSIGGHTSYVGRRFDAAVSHVAYGESFSNVTDTQVTSVMLGSALAYTGGKLAVSRQIYDSFVFVQSHESLKGRDAIIGKSFDGGVYMGRSGALGPAVANSLASYINQTVYYDVIDVPAGYDIGEGVKRIYPSYRSGYLITAGSDAFVSVMGRLVGRSGNPVSLISGRVVDVNDPEMKPELFFTNSVGRFAAQKLKPGHTYRVDLYSSPSESFEFTIPEDNEGLLDLQTVRLTIVDTEQ